MNLENLHVILFRVKLLRIFKHTVINRIQTNVIKQEALYFKQSVTTLYY
jgi:hypothetical protein